MASEILNKPVQDIAVTNDLIRTLIVDLIDPSAKKDEGPLKIFSDDKQSYFQKEIIIKFLVYLLLLKNSQ